MTAGRGLKGFQIWAATGMKVRCYDDFGIGGELVDVVDADIRHGRLATVR
jgi:hypothetical protein